MSIQADNILRTDSYVFLSLFTLLEEGRCAGFHDEENGTLYKPFKLLLVHDCHVHGSYFNSNFKFLKKVIH